MTTTVNNEHKNIKVPNKREQNQTCLDSAEREVHSPKGNVPNLRFKEFQGEWEKCKLGTLTTKVGSGSTPKGGNAVYTSAGHCFVRSQNVGMGYLILDEIAHINDVIHQKHKATELKEDDVLLNITGASIGRTAIATKEIEGGNVNQHVCIIRANSKVNPKFLCNYIQTKKIQNYIQSLQTGGSREGLNFEQIRSFPISLPNIAEQNKIAQLLDKLNERIATQNKIIDKLQSLIKGIAQKIVHSNKPNVRLAECLECKSSTLQESEVCEQGTYPVYGANGIVGYLDNYSTEGEAVYIIKDGSGVGTVSYVTGKCSATGTLNTLQAKEGYSLQYFYYLLKVFNFEPYKTGMAIPHIYFKDYGKAKVFCPSYTEQLQYARLLYAIESKLSIEKNILTSLSLQKQYLLRQMFI